VKKVPCERCPIRDTDCIVDVPLESLEEFRANSTSAVYRPRQVVFSEGSPAAGLYLVCQGSVKIYQSDRFGRDHILAVAGPGDVLGELPLDESEPYATSAEALTEAQLCYLPRARLTHFIERHPTVGVRLIAALSKALAQARRKVRDLALKGAESRLAGLLLQLAEPAANGSPPVARSYSRRELAEMIGVSPETAIRLLGRLNRRGCITKSGREIVLADAERLQRLANRNET
jgi:CRP/FNR family transcriptional regulator